MRQHGGRIEVSSERAAARFSASYFRSIRPFWKPGKRIEIRPDESNSINQEAACRSDDQGGSFRFPNAARLLVVDDEESLRITTAAIFEKEGYIVDTASSGDEAIDLL